MKTCIEIKKSELIDALSAALSHAGSTDWDVYCKLDGTVDTRHNTHSSDGWYEIVDLYSCTYDNVDFDNENDLVELAEWIAENWDDIEVEVYTEIDGEYDLNRVPVSLID